MSKINMATVLLIGAIALTGCSSDDNEAGNESAATPSTVSVPTKTPETPEAPEVAESETAVAVAERLKASVPTISAITEVTETNDSNGLIGRPGQYTSAAWIADTAADPSETGVDGGAVVEVFATPEDAQTRSAYIQETLASLGPAFGTEYHHLDGAVLLRVSGVLMPSQAIVYEQAFTE
ncbi:hypothetical protein [Arthrobacter sp. zg-Y1116]|uniref:hypothetical protein n=1 Tax=Arthrobacter sp. zg-Y1116 TaxID=2964611 RepID=UPI0021029B6D|nr:hypothetical protein [Arthrobacter sp. zg-Y1116]MCQ1947613.1 hypothetical protein [Arthrobacter sp. zg-Y1116]